MWDITINKFWADFQVAEALYYLATRVWLDEESADIKNTYIVFSVSTAEGHV